MAFGEGKALDPDDFGTWPKALRSLLQEHHTDLHAYEKEKRRIAERAGYDREYKYHPPSNPHTDAREAVVRQCRETLAGAQIVAYHCTRLCEDEIHDVQTNGMRPHGQAFLDERIEHRVRVGDFDEGTARILKHESATAEERKWGPLAPSRAEQICFGFGRRSFRDESGEWGNGSHFYRLLSYWGGEALYGSFGDTGEIIERLKRIGEPCILKVHVQIATIELFDAVDRLVSSYSGGSEFGGSGSQRSPVPGSDIDVIRYSDPRFEQLTRAGQWPEPLCFEETPQTPSTATEPS